MNGLSIGLPFLLVAMAGCASSAVEVVQVIEQPLVVEEAPPPVAEPVEEVSFEVDRYDVDLGRFDGGKMWTFDNPPVAWFAEEYGIDADSAWFAKARLGALRLSSGCSASFVSDRGLILTNHHCARESIVDVSRDGESLMEEGFLAATGADERKVPDLYVEQLWGNHRRYETGSRGQPHRTGGY